MLWKIAVEKTSWPLNARMFGPGVMPALRRQVATPPAFELGDVPSSTKRLRFNMTDLNVPTFRHSGSAISYNGNAVTRGAVDYIGPCPPSW
jgi:phosphatidylethanolamine-binding protein (PEBP) family uncharacterized protein